MVHVLRRGGMAWKPTLYLFLQPGTGQANGFSSPPFMHIELRMDSELMALSVVHDSSLSDSSKSTSSSSHSLPARGWNAVSDEPLDKLASALWARCGPSRWPPGQLVWIILTQPALWGSVPIISTSCVTVEVSGKGWNMPTVGKNASTLWRSLSCDCFAD